MVTSWRTGKWRKGKFSRTGVWIYDRQGDRFHIKLDRPVSYGLPGEKRRLITILGGYSPDIGGWKYVGANNQQDI